jgi:hypothetical protein
MRTIYKDKPAYHEPSGMMGKDWMEIELGGRAPYDPSMLPLLSTRMLPKLVDHVLPTLNPERKRQLVQTLQSITHAKQREYEREQARIRGYADKDEPDKQARRLSKSEGRSLKRLKALLNSK